MIVAGLDLSLTSTGVARIYCRQHLVDVDRITSKAPKTLRHSPTSKPLPPTLRQRTDRLDTLRWRIVHAVTDATLAVIEGPAYGSTNGSMHDRSGLWWLVVQELDKLAIPVVEIAPRCRMRYATGKGQASKDAVMLATFERYQDIVKVTGNDEADALILAAMGARHLGFPIEDSLPKTHIAAMDAVAWPKEVNTE